MKNNGHRTGHQMLEITLADPEVQEIFAEDVSFNFPVRVGCTSSSCSVAPRTIPRKNLSLLAYGCTHIRSVPLSSKAS